ncbi:MAG: radical SAM protein [Myxococcales bacterium]|nr:radical SAM protein [Myxococcales bacterium]
MKRVIDKLYALGTRFISYFGGEPTIRKDLIEIIEDSNKKGFFNHISTNGAFLTPEYIDRLGAAGLDVINLSVDSVLEFDRSRKDLSQCKKVLLDLLEGRKKHGFEINVNMVLTSENMHTTLDTVKFIDGLNIPISVAYINSQDTYSKAPLWDFQKEEYIPQSDLVSSRTERKQQIVAKKPYKKPWIAHSLLIQRRKKTRLSNSSTS